MRKLTKSLLLACALCAGLLTITGCHSLDPAGVYLGDKKAYDADLLISSSYETAHSFVLWEYQNRATLSKLPQIKEYADTLRVQYPTWHKAAVAARNAYLAAKTDTNATALAQALAVLRQAVSSVSQWYANAATTLPTN